MGKVGVSRSKNYSIKESYSLSLSEEDSAYTSSVFTPPIKNTFVPEEEKDNIVKNKFTKIFLSLKENFY
jgi:hypothetical protein